jgi:hypothetical protein
MSELRPGGKPVALVRAATAAGRALGWLWRRWADARAEAQCQEMADMVERLDGDTAAGDSGTAIRPLKDSEATVSHAARKRRRNSGRGGMNDCA